MTLAEGWLRVRGARTHNLQSFNLEPFPDRLIVFSGPSGCGHSQRISFEFAGVLQYTDRLLLPVVEMH